MAENLHHLFGKGLSPQQFVERMTRNREQFEMWYQQFTWAAEQDEQFFASVDTGNLRCVVIAADWCGDVVRNVPVVFRVLAKAGMDVDVLIMEEHLDVMDKFLTMGGRSIPVVLFVSASGEVLAKWGPRPRYVQEVMEQFKAENTDADAPDYQAKLQVTRQEVMRRYGEGAGYQQLIVQELKDVLASLQEHARS